MNLNYNEEKDITEITFTEDDICPDCTKMETCPLLRAIELNYVYPFTAGMQIGDCVAFEKLWIK